MKLSLHAIEQLKLMEQSGVPALKAYRDPVGLWTIGWGHHDADVRAGQTITREQADALLARDIAAKEDLVRRVILVALTQGQFDALVLFAFNVRGFGTSATRTLVSAVNRGDFSAAAAAFGLYVKGTKRVLGIPVKVTLPGLVKRRALERDLFLGLKPVWR